MKKLDYAVRLAVLAAGIGGAVMMVVAQDTSNTRKSFRTILSGYQEVPAVFTKGAGEFQLTVDPQESKVAWELEYDNLTSTPTAAHIHFGRPGTNGGVVVFLCGGSKPACPPNKTKATGEFVGADVLAVQGITAGALADLLQAIRAGATYVNVHTSTFPAGEIRGHIGRPAMAGSGGWEDDED
ncbi:MAG: CHRD domain-containing protein, partial [Rhodocyclaceae bacterium]|nr:CHRD domain-containing protein [Rhodocyclaceae bacterium]